MTEQELYILHAYSRQTLSESERAELEGKLKSDPHWQKLWSDFQLLSKGIEASGNAQIRQLIQVAGADFQLQQQQKKRRLWRNLSIAGGLVVLLLIAILWLQQQRQKFQNLERSQHQNPQALLNQQLDDLETRGFGNRVEQVSPELLKGLQAIEQQNLSLAIQQLVQVKTQSQQPIAQFFLGLAHSQSGDRIKAIQYWQNMPKDSPEALKKAARYEVSWLYAQHIWTRQRAKAIWAEIARDPRDPHQKDMQKLLEQLR
jgi:hypothetical protein